MDFKFEAKLKLSNKKIKGYLIKEKNKFYIVNGKISEYYNNDYIWFEKGKENFEVIAETIKPLFSIIDMEII